MHADVQGNHKQSLAEATFPAGTRRLLHSHFVTEEIYYITAGKGLMTADRMQATTGLQPDSTPPLVCS